MDICENIFSRNNFKPSYWHETADGPCLPITMGQLIDYAADQWGEDEAFVCLNDNARLSFKKAKEKADQLAAGLLELGLNPGDTILLWGDISDVSYITFLASARAGLILGSIHKQGNILELTECLTKVEAKALVVIESENDKRYCEILCEAIPEISSMEPGKLQSKNFPKLEIVITFCSASYTGTFSYSDVLKMGTHSSMERVNKLQTIIQPDDGFLIYFTSGSTGIPKGVLRTHHQIISRTYKDTKRYELDQKGQRIFTIYVTCDGPTMLLVIAHSFLFGCTAVFGRGDLDGERMVKSIQKERCTLVADVVNTIADIVGYIKDQNISIPYLENIIIFGSAITENFASDILKVFPKRQLFVAYGSTECGGIAYTKIANEVENVSVFQILDNIEVKVVDAEGKMVPVGKPGELWVRGDTVMEKYLNDVDRSAESKTPGGWFKTGDYFILEENGYIRFISRIKEVIKKCGEKIYPKEIENFLSTHPFVNQAHALSVPDYRVGEEVCVFVKKNIELLTEEDVKNYCRGQLLDIKIPRYVRFIDEIPKLANGKVNKIKLREMFENDEEYVQEKKNGLH